ncbi:MAG: hypothetical protein GX802_06545 [Clostridiales bacterium]|nr:hypothetical protein [Clostridiales bacterium]
MRTIISDIKRAILQPKFFIAVAITTLKILLKKPRKVLTLQKTPYIIDINGTIRFHGAFVIVVSASFPQCIVVYFKGTLYEGITR